MTPAEKRVKELIDRWLTSLDLHLEYVELNDSAYNNVQPWPVHDRPTRWVLELAKQKAVEMQAAFDSRLAMGDTKFAETMELMNFLSTLVGIQHVQRYIPLANPEHHGQGTLTELDGLKPVSKKIAQPAPASATSATTTQATVVMPPRTAPTPSTPTATSTVAATVAPTVVAKTTAVHSAVESDVTREMPRPTASAIKKPVTAVASSKTSTETKSPTAIVEALSDIHNLVINDAVRLLNWGRPWHELAELIARIADRPKLPEVRRLLRSHRAAIEMRVADAEDEKEEKQNKA